VKIPKKDGTTQPKNDSTDNWEDILCDKCGKSTRDDCDMNFEYMQMEGFWGYGSINKDEEHHEAQVCETCYDATLNLDEPSLLLQGHKNRTLLASVFLRLLLYI